MIPELDNCLCYSEKPLNQLDIQIYNKQQQIEKPQFENYDPQVEEPQVLTFGEEFRMTKDFENQLFIDPS